jgi:predicted membrane-bound spermidine synthase
MSYAMIMASLMTDFTGEEVITQCLSMGPYLLGLGLGSGYGDKVGPSERLKTLWRLEWLSVLVLPLVPLMQLLGVFLFINLSPPGTSLEGKMALQFLLGMTSVLAFISGVLGGAQLPLILKFEKMIPEEWVLAINYLGPLLAGLVVVGMNQLATPTSLQIYAIGLTQIIGLVALLTRFPKPKKSLFFLFIPLIILTVSAHLFPELETLTVKSSYMGTKATLKGLLRPAALINVLEKYGSIERVKTPYQTIDLFIEPPQSEFSSPGNASVYLNRKPQFDLFSVNIYHESMVYAGLNLLKRTPENVLILGAGDGLLLTQFQSHPEIKKITMVELDGKMLDWSRTNSFIAKLNNGSLNPVASNVELIIGDAVSFLRNNKTIYDLILIDFPFPNGHELAKLYSTEFYRLSKRSLAQDGLIVLDLPLYLNLQGSLSRESLVIIKTMRSAGLNNPLLFGPNASFIAVRAKGEKLAFDYDAFPEGLALASYLNFLAPFREEDISPEEWAKVEVNSMFWPKGL